MKDYETKLKEKQDYGTGATRDTVKGKGRFDLIPDLALARLAGVYERGGANHGDRNWEQGLPISRLIDSATRHLIQYKMSKYMPELDDEDHLAHSAWNIFAIIHTEEMIKRGSLPDELDDLPCYKKLKQEKEERVKLSSQDVTEMENDLGPLNVDIHADDATIRVHHVASGHSVTKYQDDNQRDNYVAALVELKAILEHTGYLIKDMAKPTINPDDFDFGFDDDREEIFVPKEKAARSVPLHHMMDKDICRGGRRCSHRKAGREKRIEKKDTI